MDSLDNGLGEVLKRSPIVVSAPLGPSSRRYANAALVLASRYEPRELLNRLKVMERQFGRRRRGQPWRARVLDLDIILWSGGPFSAAGLTIPHPRFRRRSFVLGPAQRIARSWRDPLTGLTLGHLRIRLTRPSPLP